MKKKILISCALGAVALWFVFRGIHWNEIAAAFRSVHVGPLLLAMLPMFGSHLFRAFRWRTILSSVKPVGLLDLFAMNAVGFLAIHVFPFRLGEAARPFLLKQRHQVPFSTGFMSIGVERIFDGIAAALVLAFGLFASPVSEQPILGTALTARDMVWMALFVLIPMLGILVAAVFQRNLMERFIRWALRFFPSHFAQRFEDLSKNLFAGLSALPNVRVLFVLTLQSLAVWGVMIFSYWLCFRAFEMSLSFTSAMVVLGISAVGVLIPALPASVGTFHAAVWAALSLYGTSKSVSVAYAVVVHALNLSYVVLAGLVFLPFVSATMREFMARKHERP